MNRYWNKTIDKSLKISRDSYYIKTKFGLLSIWSDGDGLYIDLVGAQGDTVCLVSLSEELDGLLSSIYGDSTSGLPTYSFLFDTAMISHAFDDSNVQDFIDDSHNGDTIDA